MSAAARAPRDSAARSTPSRVGSPRTPAPPTSSRKAAAREATAPETTAPGATPARDARPHAVPSRPLRPVPSRPVRTVSARTRGTGPAPRLPAAPELRLIPGGAGRTRATGSSTRRAPFVLLVVVLLVVTTIGLLVLNTAIAVNSLKAGELRTANAEKAEEVQRLEQQVVSGGTPAQLAAAAVAAGLVPAGAAAYLVIEPDGSATLRGTPEPAPGGDPAAGDGG